MSPVAERLKEKYFGDSKHPHRVFSEHVDALLDPSMTLADVGCGRTAQVLQGYRGRFAALRDSVTETEPTFREDLLRDLDVVTLLTEPVTDLAERWRSNGAS